MKMQDKIHGCFFGVMIGDALGAAVEMMKPEDILAKTDGKGISGFDHPVRRKQFKSEVFEVQPEPVAENTISDFRKSLRDILVQLHLAEPLETVKPTLVAKLTPEVPHGSTTDDWQLTDAVRKSLIRRERFDLTDQALMHVQAYQSSTSGWGGTTRDSMKQLQEYFDSKGNLGRSPLDAPVVQPNRGSGNGVAMKITPLALMHLLNKNNSNFGYDAALSQVADLGRMTHSDPRAWAAAYAVFCVMLTDWPLNDFSDKKALLDTVLAHLSSFERRYGSGGLKRFSSYLKVLLDESLLMGPIENLRDKVGTGCISTESVVFSIALFLRNPYDFRTGVLEAVNAGGDTDTVASMVGGLIGSLVGPEGIPADWVSHNAEFAKAESAAKELFYAFVKVSEESFQ